MRHGLTTRLAALFAAGLLLLNEPLRSAWGGPGLLGAWPAPFVYLFAVWALGIGAAARILRKR